MLPDTGADVTIIGILHLKLLWIPRISLELLPVTITLTADGSQMSPAMSWFQATMKLGNKTCIAKIQVQEGIQPFEWCHPMVLVAKSNGVQITVDLTKLSSQVSHLHIPHLWHSPPSTASHRLPSSSPQQMPYTTIGKWNLARRTGTSPLSSHQRQIKNCRVPWTLQLLTMLSVYE
ncbi:hypothetical protein SK128_005388, partial [Halocaridina rubra]